MSDWIAEVAILEVVAILLGAVLGWASGALKAHLRSLRPPHAVRRALFPWRRGVQA